MLKTRYVDLIMDTLLDDEIVYAKRLIKHPDSIEIKREYKTWLEKSGGVLLK